MIPVVPALLLHTVPVWHIGMILWCVGNRLGTMLLLDYRIPTPRRPVVLKQLANPSGAPASSFSVNGDNGGLGVTLS